MRARESETLAHSPQRKEITPGLAKRFGIPGLERKPAGDSREQDFGDPSASLLQVPPECPDSWDTEHAHGQHGRSELLGTPGVTSTGPGLPALVSPGWRAPSLLLWNTAFRHFVSLAKQGCVSPATQNKVLSPTS